MNLLTVRDLTVRYGSFTALNNAAFTLSAGDWLMLVGPNGAGKSTLVNAVARGVPYTGEILWQGRDIRQLRPRELAREIGVLAQNHAVSYAFTVREIVRMGRYAHSAGFFGGDPDGAERVEEALTLTGLSAFAERSVQALSGGELQRVFLAQLFAQDPKLLILDEPTNHLDLIYQKQIFALIEDWRRREGRAVISVVHDLSLARAYGTRALLLSDGVQAAAGTPEEVFAPSVLNAVYGMDVAGWMRDLLGCWQPEETRITP